MWSNTENKEDHYILYGYENILSESLLRPNRLCAKRDRLCTLFWFGVSSVFKMLHLEKS